jgi:hypothetical protein
LEDVAMTRTVERLDQLWTTEQVAERYHLTEKTLRNWRSLGVGPRSIKAGRKVLYREVDLARWEDGRGRRGS